MSDSEALINDPEPATPAAGSMAARIETKVRAELTPTHLEITDESYMHAAGAGAESHFRLLVVADVFDGMSAVQRHQAVYRTVADEMRDHIHALGLQAMTPAEWAADQARNESPDCLGGSKA